jgi:hypothetical protein
MKSTLMLVLLSSSVIVGCAPTLVGRCSMTPTACKSDRDCPPGTIAGFCIHRSDAQGTTCIWNALTSTSRGMCAGHQISRANSCIATLPPSPSDLSDCPFGTYCGGFGGNWCGTNINGVCTEGSGPGTCKSDGDCVLTSANTCVICGDGVKQAYEQCDNGSCNNGKPGDSCTSQCRLGCTCQSSQ